MSTKVQLQQGGGDRGADGIPALSTCSPAELAGGGWLVAAVG